MHDIPQDRHKERHRCRHHDATPGAAPDRSAKTALHDSFPASDPPATTAALGSRAMDPAGLMQPPAEFRGAAMVLARLRDSETAKLALEHLVRKVPLDRRRATLRSSEDGTTTLEVAASPGDVHRIAEMLHRYRRGTKAVGPAGSRA